MATLSNVTRNAECSLSYQPIPLYRDQKQTKAKIKLDLNAFCIRRPRETFFIHVENSHLIAWGIAQDDLLIVERSEEPLINELFVIEQQGKYQFYQFFSEINGEKILFSLDANKPNLRIQNWDEVNMAGVITNVVHQMRNRTSQMKYAA
ncbi:transcriptional regulator [Bibersteinia trehalosi Y31]|uniref:SOS-response transcriptional repressors/RecA-mediated autopeptidase n=2 Tax=Bibersteinia trehalosi TaxID=47735 RepID=W0R7Y2_BIBTR|nr:S24 family peptidase [Bibersteinia trehalosi]AHG86886.1 SOS-response transcriptional repressors/RecA-mediated autopeptidase [Bibersteinia trehalosi USDA-ARS-USMARC-190]OAQ14489.1 transcriptional regulator [Bibersteinia trehalosi Y31]